MKKLRKITIYILLFLGSINFVIGQNDSLSESYFLKATDFKKI
jgi:hypothetical protein